MTVEKTTEPHITVKNLTMGYGDLILMRDLDFTVNRGDVFAVMGGSGCGKSTLMRILVGLKPPHGGTVHYGETNFWDLGPAAREGMMQRFGLASAMMGSPKLLILDEPVSGLDPIGIRSIRRILEELKKNKVTLILNSHLLSEVEKTCDSVGIIHKGRMMANGPIASIVNATNPFRA